jgi:FlaA1/EpsC-like NDP-sugar epimerase
MRQPGHGIVRLVAFFEEDAGAVGVGLYSRFWRYVTLSDLVPIWTAVSVASVLFSAATLMAVSTGFVVGYPRSVPAIDWLLTLFTVAGVRVAVRVFAEARAAGRARPRQVERRRVLVVGAGEAGALVVRELERNPQLGLIPVGFLDDDRAKHGKKIHPNHRIFPAAGFELMSDAV